MSVTVYSEHNIANGLVRRRYEVTLTDNLGDDHTYVLGMYNHLPSNDGLEVEADKLVSAANQEIQQWIQEMESGSDPWHTDPFINSVPLWNTWSDAASESLKHFLLSDDRQDLLNVEASSGSTSNNDLDDLLLLAESSFTQSDLRTEIQQAINTQVELDTYIPSVEE